MKTVIGNFSKRIQRVQLWPARRTLVFSAILLVLLSALMLTTALGAAPQSEPKESLNTRNLTNPTGEGPAAQGLVIAAETGFDSFPIGNVPPSTGFDFPVGGSWAHEGFEMYNCFGCDLDSPGFQGHTGEDFYNARAGDPVYSVSEGIVVYSGMGPGLWGNIIIVQHKAQNSTVYSQYAHLTTMNVGRGQVVGRRQQIGTVGTTGTTEPHLHFEIKDRPIIGHGYTGYGFSAYTVSAWGVNYFLPTWYIQNHRHLDSPFGVVDFVGPTPTGFRISGWALDPDTPAFIAVHIYVDGQLLSVLAASEERPDIGAGFPGSGSAHGFSTRINIADGAHNICVYGINAGVGHNNLIGCSEFEVGGNPFGSLDAASFDNNGQLHASGWAIDPDTGSPIDVHIYVNGRLSAITTAGSERADIAEVYPDYGAGHGFQAAASMLDADNTVCAYGINTQTGDNALLSCRTARGDWDTFPSTTPPSGRHYYWPWYDAANSSNWVLMGNPAGAATLSFDLNIGGKSPGLFAFGGPSVTAGKSIFASYGGLVGGPVVATSLTGEKALASQRILWAGDSLEEVPATDAEDLSDHYFWTWYDQKSPGYQNWILVSNPEPANGSRALNAAPGVTTGSIYYEITVAGENPGPGSTGSIQPGQSVTPAFPGVRGGPVELKAWTDSSKTTPAKVMTSQRVLTNYGKAFNEVAGIPAADLSSRYLWNWYDQQSRGATDWVLLANPNPANVDPADTTGSIYYEITVAGADPGPGSTGTILAGKNVFPNFPGIKGGPVEVRAYTDSSRTAPAFVIASQRVIWGPSFEETPGNGEIYKYPVTSTYDWTWYDHSSPGAANWIVVSNPNPARSDPADTTGSVYYEITVAGASPGPGSTGTILAGNNVTPTFPGLIGGPVEVKGYTDASKAQPATIMASQRVLWNGHFNEVPGTVLEH